MVFRLNRTSLKTPLPVRCEGSRVFIRPPCSDDWQQWQKLRRESRSFLEPWEPTWPPDALSRSSFTRRLAFQMQDWRSGRAYPFLVFTQSTETLTGGVGLSNVRRGVAQSATLGYWCGKNCCRRGYTFEAARLALDFAFVDLKLHRIEASCLPENQASAALLRKLGFREEGRARDYLRIAGEWRDHLLFGLIRKDWEDFCIS